MDADFVCAFREFGEGFCEPLEIGGVTGRHQKMVGHLEGTVEALLHRLVDESGKKSWLAEEDVLAAANLVESWKSLRP